MGNNPASSVISGSDFFKENERFSDDDETIMGDDVITNSNKTKHANEDDEVASLMTTRTLTRLAHSRQQQQNINNNTSRASTRSPTMSIISKRSYSCQPLPNHSRNNDTHFYNRILSKTSGKASDGLQAITTKNRSPSTISKIQSNQHYKPTIAVDNTTTTSTTKSRLSRKTINQNRLNESFYENLTEATLTSASLSSSLVSKPTSNTNKTNITVEPLPQDALNWLKNAGITLISPRNLTQPPLQRHSRPLAPPPPPPPPPSSSSKPIESLTNSSLSACLVLYDPPKVVLNRRIRNLGVSQVDPLAYAAKFGDTLVSASNLPSIVKHIRPRNGALLAAESASMRLRDTIKLVGDVGALSLLNQHRQQQQHLQQQHHRRRYSIASDSF